MTDHINLAEFISHYPHLKLIREKKLDFIGIEKETGTDDISKLLKLLHEEKMEIFFHDTVHPTYSDPGAYFSYSTKKSKNKEHWSMTYGNHGWSGGIYQINDFVVAQQILSLIKKDQMDKIQISNVGFFDDLPLKSEEESEKKSSEIAEMHR